ncbi:hypothetical protein [Ralstonia insidiosa]|uniref:hypothetical protein n=1 Tax=Ralstonia insidiosa TaxID=190721 RepID=UPI000CEEA047|nr:hypothetical protein [Ralstonia insidiosa]
MDEKQTAALREAFEKRAKFLGFVRLTREGDGYKANSLDHLWREWLACYQHLEPQLKDAERYRYLRDISRLPDECDGEIVAGTVGGEDLLFNEHLDKAIDAALALQKEKQQ